MTAPASHQDLDPLQARAILREHRFHSNAPVVGPLIAWLRERWNSVSTKWYVRPLIQQQNEFNILVVDRLAEHAARLAGLEARLAEQTARLGRLSEAHEARLGALEVSRNDLLLRSGEHDAWLVDQDHDQAALTHNQAEITARLAQMERLLADIDRRLARIETAAGSLPESS